MPHATMDGDRNPPTAGAVEEDDDFVKFLSLQSGAAANGEDLLGSINDRELDVGEKASTLR